MTLLRMFTGLVARVLFKPVPPPSPKPQQEAPLPPPVAPVSSPMSEERARFIAAFLQYAFIFHKRKVISIFCHSDKPFPEVLCGGKIENVRVQGAGDDWWVNFSLNRHGWFVDGYVDIELVRDTPVLRVKPSTGSGASIQMLFIPEGGYGLAGEYDLWAITRRALDDHEYFKFVGRGQ